VPYIFGGMGRVNLQMPRAYAFAEIEIILNLDYLSDESFFSSESVSTNMVILAGGEARAKPDRRRPGGATFR